MIGWNVKVTLSAGSHEDEQPVEWTGEMIDFWHENQGCYDFDRLRLDLEQHGMTVLGGGAEPVFTLRVAK